MNNLPRYHGTTVILELSVAHWTYAHATTVPRYKCTLNLYARAQKKFAHLRKKSFPDVQELFSIYFWFNSYHGNPQKSIQFCRKKSFAHLHKCTEKICAAAQCVSVQVAIYALNSCASAKCIYAHYPKECMSRYGGYQSTNGRFVFVLAANWSLRVFNFW